MKVTSEVIEAIRISILVEELQGTLQPGIQPWDQWFIGKLPNVHADEDGVFWITAPDTGTVRKWLSADDCDRSILMRVYKMMPEAFKP